MKKIPLILGFTILLLFSLASCGEEEIKEIDNTTPVEIALVERGSISAENSVSGQVSSGNQQTIFVALSVRCTDVYVKVGDTVAAGQTICTLDMASTWANYEMAVSSYNAAKKSYQDQAALLSKQVAQAEKNVTDTQALLDIGAASQLELDTAIMTLENARASMNSALSQLDLSVQNAKSSLVQLESSLSNIDRSGNIKAPVTGTILSLNAVKDGFVAPSAPVAVIDSSADLQVATMVSESLVPKLSPGGIATISISSVEKEFQGTIESVSHSPNQQTHLYPVMVKIPPAYAEGLMSGMFADITFYTDTQNNVILVPTEAIQTGINGQYVYTIDENNTAHQIPVETGLVGNGITEITSGLAGGERLVTVGQFYLSDGAQVRIVSAEV